MATDRNLPARLRRPRRAGPGRRHARPRTTLVLLLLPTLVSGIGSALVSAPAVGAAPRATAGTAATPTAATGSATGSATRPASEGTATVVAAYREGRRDAILNGYGLPGIGTFLLRTPAGDRPALCLEAHVAHTTAPGAYRPVPTSAPSPRLDYLLWRHLGDGAGGAAVDPDTATALAALAWFETGAVRRGGGAVWADPARGFAPITPRTPPRGTRCPDSPSPTPSDSVRVAATSRPPSVGCSTSTSSRSHTVGPGPCRPLGRAATRSTYG